MTMTELPYGHLSAGIYSDKADALVNLRTVQRSEAV